MSLGAKLGIVFAAFLAVLVAVMWMSFRERRLSRDIADDDIPAQQAQDARVMTIVFSAILGGMLLTVLVAWLVFF
jgi:membrane protein implicated in regulation of membrane protease activity